MPKVHYNSEAPYVESNLGNRVSLTCGAITHHNPDNQHYVVETRKPEYVTCKNCLRLLKGKND